MPSKKRQELYDMFSTGNKPTHDDFVDLIDSAINIVEDGIGITEKGKPMEIIEQGANRRLIDFSSAKDTPIWRLSAQSIENSRSGLTFASSNKTRLFINQESGSAGINTDNPLAKVHIISESYDGFRVDDINENPSIIIASNGNVSIGSDNTDSYKLTVHGTAGLRDDVTVDGILNANNGITVNGFMLDARQGIRAREGMIIDTGKLEAKNGVVVSGTLLEANAGAVIRGSTLQVENGLSVKGGLILDSGDLEAKNGFIVNGTFNAKADALIEGQLTAQNGITISNGAVIETGLVEAREGITVSSGELLAQSGATINGEFIVQDGAVIYNNVVLESGMLEAKAGLIVSGTDLRAENGLRVNNGARIETGELIVQAGITVNSSPLQATGPVILGNTIDGEVTINGLLNANNSIIVTGNALQAQAGIVVSGSELVAQNGATIMGNFNAPDYVTLGTAIVDTLQANSVTISEDLNLQSVGVSNLNASYATIGDININGTCAVMSNVNLATGKLYATYIGSTADTPRIRVEKGIVTGGDGHYTIQIDDTKLLRIIYDDESIMQTFMLDWQNYKNEYPDQAEGFHFLIMNFGSWEIKDEEIVFSTAGNIFKEHKVVGNGLHFIYTGPIDNTPHVNIIEGADIDKFDVIISGFELTIYYPQDINYRTVDNLLNYWALWKNNNQNIALNYEIEKIDGAASNIVTELSVDLVENPESNILYNGIIRTNVVNIEGDFKFRDSDIRISSISSSTALAENSNTILPTQRAVKAYADTKADNAAMIAALETKADLSAMEIALNNKASLNGSASQDFSTADLIINGTFGFVTGTTINEISDDDTLVDASATAIPTEKAVKAYADTKANNSMMIAALGSKANAKILSDISIAAEGTNTVNDLILTTNSRGMLMVYIIKQSDSSALATGLFSLHGNNVVTKIAGDGLSDTQGGSTYNMYYDVLNLTIENTSTTDAIIVKLTYFGI